jgi:hypothetical protein
MGECVAQGVCGDVAAALRRMGFAGLVGCRSETFDDQGYTRRCTQGPRLVARCLQEDGQKRLVDALFSASRHKRVQLHINTRDWLARRPKPSRPYGRPRPTRRWRRPLHSPLLPMVRHRLIRGFLARPSISLPRARTLERSISRRRNSGRLPQTLVPTSLKATTSIAPGRTSIGARITRDYGR